MERKLKPERVWRMVVLKLLPLINLLFCLFVFLQLNPAFHLMAPANRSKWCTTRCESPDWALGSISHLMIFSIVETISLKIWERPLPGHAKCSLQAFVCVPCLSSLSFQATRTITGKHNVRNRSTKTYNHSLSKDHSPLFLHIPLLYQTL